MKADWDAWNARSLTDEPVVRHSRWHWLSLSCAWSKGAAAVKAWAGRATAFLDDLIGRELPQPSGSLTPQTRRMPVRDLICGAKLRLAAAAIRPYRCTINVPLHDKHAFDTHVLAARRRHRQNGP